MRRRHYLNKPLTVCQEKGLKPVSDLTDSELAAIFALYTKEIAIAMAEIRVGYRMMVSDVEKMKDKYAQILEEINVRELYR